jgi:hypothetical protein
MGVHDYRCSVCGTPGSYTCGEKTGKKCEQEGVGEDRAVLDLFFFAQDDAPEDASEFEAARGRARRVETRPFGYDWGEWEFVPSLNYRQLLMDDEDTTGIWRIQPFDGDDLGDGSPVSLEIPPDEQVWVVNYCPPCRALFVDRATPAEEPCVEYLRSIAEQLEVDFEGEGGSAAKAPFIEDIRARVARRRASKP